MEVSYSVNNRPATDVRSARTGQLIALIFVFVGGLLVAIAAVIGWHESSFLDRTLHTKGLVVALDARVNPDFHRRGVRDRAPTYAPTFTFADRDGKEYRVTSGAGTNPPSYLVGQNVDVFYPPEAPDQAQIQGFFVQWGMPMIIGGIGAVQFLLGSLLAFAFRRQARRWQT